MKKIDILQRLEKVGIIAVIRADTKHDAIAASVACIAGGVLGIEVAYTTPQATEVIATLTEKYATHQDVIIGAGTILESVTAGIAIQAGADFVVSPYFDSASAKICNLYQIPYLPGCLTPTEIKEALSFGVEIIKLFPSSEFSPQYVKDIKAPLPQVNIMPTGGINLETMQAWFEQGVIAVGVGGDLLAPLAQKNFSEITSKAKDYANRFKEIKQAIKK